MAIFHLSVKTVSRSAGRSATAASAYRAGVEITDERTGEIHDYRRRGGVESAHLFLPAGAPEWASERNALWNAAEKSETRKNSTVAREFEVALPAELTPGERQALAHEFTKALVEKYGFAADCAIHFPHKKENQSKRNDAAVENGDSRNHHAHILCSTRKLTAEGFTVKTRELDDRKTGADQVVECRALFADMANAALAKAGHSARVDHRSLVAQGIDDRDAGIHLGPIATAIERRGEVSEKTQNHQARQAEAAGKVAALVAIAQAQVQAAEQALAAAQAQAQAQAQAEHAALAAAQARNLAISTELTALRKIENDRVRDEAFGSIDRHVAAAGRSSAATGRALVFAQSDHAIIGKNLAAAGGDLGRAVESARGRQHRRHAREIAQALGRRLERIVPALAALPGRVEHHLVELAAKARRAQARRRLEKDKKDKKDKAVLDLAAAQAERDRPPAAGIDPRSYYHPDKVAARLAAQPTSAPQAKRAADAGVADLRTPFQRSRQEAAQQAAQPHQEDQDNQGQAERQRIEGMSAAELRAEIARLRPPPLREVVERQPELVTARQSSDTLAEQWRQAQAMAAQAGRELENWRSAHPVRAKAHDSGLMRAAVLVETEQRRQDAQAQRQRLAPCVEAATEHLKRTRSSVEERVKLEQAPALAKVAELERIERQRQDQEQAERAKAQELDEVLSAFKGHALKRETKSLGYGDTGPQWRAIPEPLRKAIEDFNRLPQEARPAVLERMRKNLQRDPQGVETFRQGLQPSREIDRGMSR